MTSSVFSKADLAPEMRDPYPKQADIDALVGAITKCNYAEAERLALAITQAFPSHPIGWKALGVVFVLTGKIEQALAPMQRSAELSPHDAEGHSNLGHTLGSLGRFEEAQASCRRAIALRPDYPEAHNNLGNTLRDLGCLLEAEASCRQAIALRPDYAEAHSNLGVTLMALGRPLQAQASYRQAIALKHDYAEAHNNLGNTLKDFGRLSQAEDSYRQAIALKPDYAEAHSNLGVVLIALGRLSEAAASYRQAIALKPDYVEAHSNLLFGMNYAGYLSVTASLEEARRYGASVSQKAGHKYTAWHCPQAPDKLRIGFVSGDLRNHPVGYFLEGLLSNIDRSKFELIAYTNTPAEDELTARIKAYFSLWRSLVGQRNEAAAKLIHDDGVHILIDLAGHSAHNRLPVFAYKPAPVQVSWLGYFATTGVEEIDYLLGDPYVTPVAEDHHFCERVWRLPETYLCFTPPALDIEVGELPAMSNGYVTFGCFNNLSKLNDAVIALLAKVLHAVKDSRLLLKAKQFADSNVRQVMIQRFALLNVGLDRLTIEGPSSRPDYFASYNRVDMALDPFPFPGGTTSVEGLWMGVPVITKRGDRFIAHNGETIANNAGQSEWIAQDENDYVLKAKTFASDLNALAKIRAGLRAQVLASPLFDSKRFARHFEEAMAGMWDRYKA